jgi:hypothetical protein
MKTGICAISGRQDPKGFTWCFLYISIISWLRRWRSSLYFSCSALISGAMSCMPRMDLACLTASGTSSARTTTVSAMIEKPQPIPTVSWKKRRTSSNASTMVWSGWKTEKGI